MYYLSLSLNVSIKFINTFFGFALRQILTHGLINKIVIKMKNFVQVASLKIIYYLLEMNMKRE
jgi:uncharacterized membrane protein YjjP (DUF1212 family)